MRRLTTIALAALLALAAAVAALWLALPDPAVYARQNPRTTSLIEQRRAEARRARRLFRPRQVWVSLDRVAPCLVQAVLSSEDAGFYAHGPFDYREMGAAAREAVQSEGRRLRGASTLTQQLAKNLWLGTERSLWRKAKEAVLAVKLEHRLPKRRILALYLNVAEWGDGVFGVEAAARERFGVAAADLTPAQAALLAAMLPAPRRADLAHPSRWLAGRARRVLDRLLEGGHLEAAAHAHASAELERTLGGALDGREEEEPPDDEALESGGG